LVDAPQDGLPRRCALNDLFCHLKPPETVSE
jgi:hypothetical protein